MNKISISKEEADKLYKKLVKYREQVVEARKNNREHNYSASLSGFVLFGDCEEDWKKAFLAMFAVKVMDANIQIPTMQDPYDFKCFIEDIFREGYVSGFHNALKNLASCLKDNIDFE